MEPLTLATATLLTTCTYLVYRLFLAKPGPPNGPPCLPSLPIVGSIPFLHTYDRLFLCFMDKATRYGNIFAFYAGSRYTVVLNGRNAIYEALVKKSVHFAGRVPFYTEQHVFNPTRAGIIFKQYDEGYKRNQQNTLTILKQYGFGDTNAMEAKIHDEITEKLNFFKSINSAPINPLDTIDFANLNVIYGVLFGEKLQENDETHNFLRSTIRTVNFSFTTILLAFPMAAHLPHYRKMLSDLAPVGRDFANFCQKQIEKSRNVPDPNSNFVKDYIQRLGKDYDEKELVFILRDLFMAAAETLSTTITWALIYLANHQDIQRRAQREIDGVVPRGGLPSTADKAKLPYTEAVMLEAMRVRTLSPMASPHVTMMDTEVCGYKIPADTLVLVNLWSAHMDPAEWSEPEEFCPDRFYDESSGQVINQNHVVAFSLGKRACMGEVLARQELFLFFTAILHNFTALPPEGSPSVSTATVVGGNTSPGPIHMRLVPRD